MSATDLATKLQRGGTGMMLARNLLIACIGLCALAEDASAQSTSKPLRPIPSRSMPSPSTQPPQFRSPVQQQLPPPNAGPAGPNEIWRMPDRDRVNDGTVTVITAPAGGATSVFGSDMARVLDDDATVRVLPVLGKGPVRNVTDILYLKSIDMGAVAADVPEFYRLQYNIPDITSKLRYIAKLYHNEIHIIATQAIKSISDLQGKRIISPTDVGYYSAKVIFSRLGINANFDYLTDDARAIQKLIDGQADAYITSTGKVFQLARNIKNENRALHLVPIQYDSRLQDLYLPTTLSGEEYPNLLSPGQTIDTVATSVLLVSFNWPENSERYKRVARFVDTFFSKIDEFRNPPRHPKWQEASISAVIPGWQRFKAADDWLLEHNLSPSSQGSEVEKLRFNQFLVESGSKLASDPAERGVLFRRFLEWQKQKGPL
jgi:TRAP-type uncharacterized transport system substrate-binding protein